MKNNIFYSWQSDLPNNENRGFIESCISASIKELSKTKEFQLDINLDRDTKNELGTPDIVNTIFSKIEKSKIFIADISIINGNSNGRKTPNPNVLLELGYAAKVLGWEKIICIFNTDYGDFDDLPFDLRFRRPLSYSLKGKVKSETKKFIVKVISQTIQELHIKGLLDDGINDYFKMQVDTQVLSILGHLSKIVYGYEKKKFDSYKTLINLKYDDILQLLSKRKYIGFQVYKKFEPIGKELKNLLDSFTSTYFNKEIGIAIVNFIQWIDRFDKVNSLRLSPDLFISSHEKVKGYKTIYAPEMNPNNKDSYLLLKELNDKDGQVVDFGKFQEIQKIDAMLNYVYLNEKYSEIYANLILEIIELAWKWIDNTNKELIVDNINHFETSSVVLPPQKIKNALSKKNTSIKDDISALLKSRFNFDYGDIVQINAFLHFFRQGFIIDNQQKMVENIQRRLKGKIKLNSAFSILPLEDEFGINQVLSETVRQRGLENLNSIRQGYFNVDYIYVTHKYGNAIDALLRLIENQSLEGKARELLWKIVKDSQNNLLHHLIEPLREFIVESSKMNYGNSLNIVSLIDEFNKIRIYHEKDINCFISEVRHLIVD
ncbi:hypothetical protein [Paenibacillus faecalis]|uniref:hypothetical protein n=1 Tax=Paenibacillus faecalis TaxID=2079532 RepID=UPI000D0F21D5|nr:hypothetical protein [Paenibacillus faecalis]